MIDGILEKIKVLEAKVKILEEDKAIKTKEINDLEKLLQNRSNEATSCRPEMCNRLNLTRLRSVQKKSM